MFENNFRQSKGRGRGKTRPGDRDDPSNPTLNRGGQQSNRLITRQQALNAYIEDLMLNIDRYHLWWTGPPEEDMFKPASWSINHSPSSNAVFSMAVIQGHNDKNACSKPLHDFKLYIGTLRRFYTEDIVLAVESSTLALDPEIKSFLTEHKVVVYELSSYLCSKETKNIFCGSSDERVPASVFRYFFYEKWAALYQPSSLILLTDFRDVVFQANPFTYRLSDWYPDHQLAVFQEFYPNMVINRCHFNRMVMLECFGADALESIGRHIIISSGGLLGSRDAILAWSHHMTTVSRLRPRDLFVSI
jgi:hypothetical protein